MTSAKVFVSCWDDGLEISQRAPTPCIEPPTKELVWGKSSFEYVKGFTRKPESITLENARRRWYFAFKLMYRICIMTLNKITNESEWQTTNLEFYFIILADLVARGSRIGPNIFSSLIQLILLEFGPHRIRCSWTRIRVLCASTTHSTWIL